jgi:hypothetical protein
VYTEPEERNLLGMKMGEEIREDKDKDKAPEGEGEGVVVLVRLERYCCRSSEVFLTEEEITETLIDKDFHSRPAEPVDDAKSKSKSSQAPNSLGIDTVTTGAVNLSGGEMVMF